MIHRSTFIVASLVLGAFSLSATAAVTWEETFSKSDELKAPEKKPKNSKKGDKGNYLPFEVTGPAIRITFETTKAGRRSGLVMELEQLNKRGDRESWKRVAVIGRTRGDGKGVKSMRTMPGKYRISLDGSEIKYTITVEEATVTKDSKPVKKREIKTPPVKKKPEVDPEDKKEE